MIHSKVLSLGKYGRCICDLWLPKVGKNLSAFLIEQGLAWQTDDSGSLTQLRSVDSLHGIPAAIKQQVREALA